MKTKISMIMMVTVMTLHKSYQQYYFLNCATGISIWGHVEQACSLVNSGRWIIKRTENSTPYAVWLFSKENCTCPTAGLCYHVIVCKLMIGQKVYEVASNPNMTLLQQKSRWKDKEKPSGRKPPRIKDFDNQEKEKVHT